MYLAFLNVVTLVSVWYLAYKIWDARFAPRQGEQFWYGAMLVAILLAWQTTYQWHHHQEIAALLGAN